jgi:hypothetical protein
VAKRKRDDLDSEFTPEVYLTAAQEWLGTVESLYYRGFYTLALYVAGVAVESMFRAYRCRIDPVFDSRHNLYELAKAARFIEIVPATRLDEYDSALSKVATRWTNNHRYRSDAAMRAFFRRAQLSRGIKGDFLKENCRRAIDGAFVLIRIGAEKWTL